MNSALPNIRTCAIRWEDNGIKVLDQRKLPRQVDYHFLTRAHEVAEAIRSMKIRGAPLIGIAAAYGVVLAARTRFAANPSTWKNTIERDLDVLGSSRPTAVNLFWALDTMREQIEPIEGDPFQPLLETAIRIHEDDINANLRIGDIGAEILSGTQGVLTHCNAGSLATGGYGTALGVIRSACRNGLKSIYATETRPWNQGSRLTLWELQQDGIEATLITDSAAASLMRSKAVDWIVVGADRIAANGDVANKIGTYSLAILAEKHDIGFMVAAPMSTVDWDIPSGDAIEIEYRDKQELLKDLYLESGHGIDVWNPVFDITPGNLIDVIVTEKRAIGKPIADQMEKLR